MKKFLIIIMVCCTCLVGRLAGFEALTQPTSSLIGKVRDSQGEPIPGITVVLKETRQGAITDGQGKFSIPDIKAATYTIEVSGVSFEKQVFTLTFKEGDKLTRSIILKENTTEMDEVVVTAESEGRALKLSAKSVQVIETREVKLQSADLGEVMAKSEGISVQRAGGLGSNTRFALNGLSGDKVRFFYDGIPLDFTPYAFGIANVPVNAIQRVEVYKGVVPIQFGADALGGAVNLASPEVYEGWAGSASYQLGSFNTHRVTASINYANDKTGLFLVVGGFYDYTDNNYKIDVAIPNEQGQLQQETVKRFHDGYKAFGTNFRVGIRDKKWANELSLAGYYGNYNNEVQNSQSPGLVDYPQLGIDKAVAANPFGDLRFTSFSQGLNLHYNANPTKKWELNLKAGYNYNERVSIDTSRNLYNWHGEVVRVQNQPGEFGQDDHLITKSQNYFVRQQVGYKLSEKHAIKLAVSPTYAYRTGDDLLIEGEFDPALDDGHLFDLVSGLEYSGELMNEKLQITAFAKNYRQSIRIESVDPSVEGLQVAERSVNNYGAGTGLRHAWTPRFATKLSYEYAYRLPRQNEIFGNGQLTGRNLELKPENSHNVNLQWTVESKATAKTEWQVQGNFFLRRVNDLIFLSTNSEGVGVYDNVWSANSQGIELGGRVKNLVKRLTLNANSTYQSYFNTSDEGPFASFKGDRIPNTPYFFANSGAEYQLEDVIQKSDRLSIFWNMRYVHLYFIGWESAGLAQYKAQTPGQFTHAVGITQKINVKNIQTALTLEVQNLTNAKVFDFYGVQRPGRAFYLKLTTQF
ncbi:TonB-dependent receptor [Reichenbachiella sp. MALMAid0571]|uniref:TonB-dependent receptor n=1 Tax=Reichenbachiella sp. MALMAid0571 TaxID=3143939 RepID=UPI0032DFB465